MHIILKVVEKQKQYHFFYLTKIKIKFSSEKNFRLCPILFAFTLQMTYGLL